MHPSKPAPTDLPILDVIKNRWSSRAMTGDSISQEQIDTIFEAARWAPSSSNLQEWHYVYATKDDGADRERLESLLESGNAWAKTGYILAIGFAYTKRKRSTGEVVDNPYALYDTGMATGFLVLQASSMGFVTHQMAGFDRGGANALLGVPLEYVPASMIAIGHPSDPSQLPPEKQAGETKPRERKPQQEFVFRGKWAHVEN